MSPTQLYRHFDANGRLLYVGISASATNRLGQHKRKAAWFGLIANITVETFPTRRDALVAEAIAIRDEKPLCNTMAPDPETVSDDRYAPVGGRMVRRASGKLSAIFMRSAKPGRYCDGDNLYLFVKPNGSKYWVFRYKPTGGKLREMGLGRAGEGRNDVTLAEARDKASEAFRKLRSGTDPLAERALTRALADADKAGASK